LLKNNSQTNRVDYCNSVLAAAPKTTTDKLQRVLNAAARVGATENARHENTGRSKMQGWKMGDMNLRHQNARVENARHENAAPECKGGKCGKS